MNEEQKQTLREDWREATESNGLSREIRNEIADWWFDRMEEIITRHTIKS